MKNDEIITKRKTEEKRERMKKEKVREANTERGARAGEGGMKRKKRS